MKNQREELRVVARGSVSYTPSLKDARVGGNARMQSGLLSNLSKNGGCIFTQERITSERITIFINGEKDKPLNAEVLWCSESDENLFKVGLRFQ